MSREHCIGCGKIRTFIVYSEGRWVIVKCSECGFRKYEGLMYDTDVAEKYVENYTPGD